MKQILVWAMVLFLSLGFIGCGTDKENEPDNPAIEQPGGDDDNTTPDDKDNPTCYDWSLQVVHNWDAIQKEWTNRCPEMDQWIEEHKQYIVQESGFPPLNGSVTYYFTMPSQSTEDITNYCNNIIRWSIGWDLPINETEKYWAYDIFYVIATNTSNQEELKFYPDVKDSYPY